MLFRDATSSQCIFCAFNQSYRRFSTAQPRWRDKANAYRKARSKHLKSSRGSEKRMGTDDPPRRPRKAPSNIKSSLSGNSHKSFTPSRGESFDRKEKDPSDIKSFLSGNSHKSFAPSRGESFDRKEKDPNAILHRRLALLEEQLHIDPILQRLGLGKDELARRFRKYKANFEPPTAEVLRGGKPLNPLLERMRTVAKSKDGPAVDRELKYGFYGSAVSSKVQISNQTFQEHLLNLNHPSEWYPRTRGVQREIHVHVGPTNSGKTYHALKRLEEAETGVYAGPLRLLAHEIYMRLNARGKKCNLVTGDERRLHEDATETINMISCTVEMVPKDQIYDVAVIDEIQMIGSEDRGWAWTQALLGVMAREVHVCGEERSVPIIQEIAAACGETVKVHRYERLSPLKMMPDSLEGNLKQLQKGDCIVGFSVVVIHSLRQYIERVTKRKCAIIYGSLPPETRAQQAKLFNDPDNEYDFLVASNAVGMGLNLSIKRLIFQAAHRTIRGRLEPLSVPDIKQIAGRAGRYSTASQDMKASVGNQTQAPAKVESNDSPSTTAPAKAKNLGLVTTLEKLDYPIIAKAMRTDPQPITSAGIMPPNEVIEKFARYHPAGTPLSFLLLRLVELAKTNQRFFMCDIKTQVSIADAIEPVPGLNISERLEFCAAPIEVKREGEPELARAYATMVGDARPANVLDIKELDIELLEDDYTADKEYLRKLERLHKGLIIFTWLAYRFVGVFMDLPLASHVKGLVEKRIEDTIGKMSFDYQSLRKSRDQALLDLLEDKEDLPEREDEKGADAESLREMAASAAEQVGVDGADAKDAKNDETEDGEIEDDLEQTDDVHTESEGHEASNTASDPQSVGEDPQLRYKDGYVGVDNLPNVHNPEQPQTPQ